MVGGRIRQLRLICAVLAISLLLTACDALPDPIGQEVDQLFNQLLQQASDYVNHLVEQQIDRFVEKNIDPITDGIADIFDYPLTYLGLSIPDDVGKVSLGINPLSSKKVIEEKFKEQYKSIGGGRVIGWPDGLVNYWEGSDRTLLVQFFSGGSEEKSALVMKDGDNSAYVISGDWLQMYKNLGGPKLAGFPNSNSQTWNINPIWEVWKTWGRGDRQLYQYQGKIYGFLRASGTNSVFIVPPDLWYLYASSAYKRIGYPLSSYPIDDLLWQSNSLISSSTRDILNQWNSQPYRTQVFENGSLFWVKDTSRIEIVDFTKLVDFLNLGDSVLLRGVRVELGETYWDLYYSGTGDTCFARTLRLGANMAVELSGDLLIPQVAFIPLRATLIAIAPLVESVYGKLAIFAVEVLVDRATGIELTDSVKSILIGNAVDAVYSKLVGDILSIPLAPVTGAILEEEISKLDRDRKAYESSIQIGDGVITKEADMNAHLAVEYDPITNFVNGVITSDCAPKGYAFFYMVNVQLGETADPTDVWNGQVHYLDLATGDVP